MSEEKVTHSFINEWSAKIIEETKSFFELTGSAPAHVWYLLKDGKAETIDSNKFMKNDESKDLLSLALRGFAKDYPVVAYVFISEVWMTKRKAIKGVEATYKNYGRPSEQADKQECLMINVETNLGMQQNFFLIKRDASHPYLEDFMKDERPTHIAGRFTNFLAKPYNEN